MNLHDTNPAPTAIFVSIGTDVHAFTRLIDWMDEFIEGHPELANQVLVQHGSTRPTRLARNVAFLDYDELQQVFADARIVVSHGGPATIFEARAHGRLPIVVPRNPQLDEHVDGHQQRFARHLAEDGLVALCETKERLFQTLESQLADPASATVTPGSEHLRQTMANLEDVVQGLSAQPPLWRRLFANRAKAA